MKDIFKNIYVITVLLILINLVAHFLPFERTALAPDDYAALVRAKSVNLSEVPYQMLKYPDRPLNYTVLVLQGKIFGDNPTAGLLLIFFSNMLVLLAVFYLFKQLLGDNFTAFLGSVIFCLIPNKLEAYHTPIFFNMNIVIFIYLLSLIMFIRFVKNAKTGNLLMALLAYTIGIFWYEVGFFLPFLMAIYAYLYKKSSLKNVIYFGIPMMLFAIYRFSGVFGTAVVTTSLHNVDLSRIPTRAITDLLHNYGGRYFIRSVIYGVYKFISLPKEWLLTISMLNVAVIVIMYSWLKNVRSYTLIIDKRLAFFAACLFFVFVAPMFFNYGCGIAGRHLMLPSVAVSIFTIWILSNIRKSWRVVFIVLMFVMLIISEGNAWCQVIACRINGALYDTIKEKKQELLASDNIVIDTKSFADNIPFTFISRDFNVLNTYYGAQAFEDWGIKSMVGIVLDGAEKPVYIATENPFINRDGFIEFKISKNEGYRMVSKKSVIIPKTKTAIINFKSVYGEHFNNGMRNRKR